MTNKERYQQAFSALPSSRQLHLEVEEMAQIQKKHKKNIAVAAAVACAALIGASGTAYAADLGGIQTKVNIWLNGRQVEAVETPNENGRSFTFTYEGEDGTESLGFGGVSIDEDGTVTIAAKALEELKVGSYTPMVVFNDSYNTTSTGNFLLVVTDSSEGSSDGSGTEGDSGTGGTEGTEKPGSGETEGSGTTEDSSKK